jgi:hypothetical protein
LRGVRKVVKSHFWGDGMYFEGVISLYLYTEEQVGKSFYQGIVTQVAEVFYLLFEHGYGNHELVLGFPMDAVGLIESSKVQDIADILVYRGRDMP